MSVSSPQAPFLIVAKPEPSPQPVPRLFLIVHPLGVYPTTHTECSFGSPSDMSGEYVDPRLVVKSKKSSHTYMSVTIGPFVIVDRASDVVINAKSRRVE